MCKEKWRNINPGDTFFSLPGKVNLTASEYMEFYYLVEFQNLG